MYTFAIIWIISIIILNVYWSFKEDSDDSEASEKQTSIFWQLIYSFFIAVPIWIVYDIVFGSGFSLLILALIIFLAFKSLVFLGAGLNGGSSNESRSNRGASSSSSSKRHYYLQRFNGTTWYTIMNSAAESHLYSHMEIEKQKDLKNGNLKTRYRVLDSNGRVVS